MELVFFIICFLASIVGAICGIGGGVIACDRCGGREFSVYNIFLTDSKPGVFDVYEKYT